LQLLDQSILLLLGPALEMMVRAIQPK